MYSLSLNIFDFVIIENVLIFFFFLFKALITAEESNPPDKKLAIRIKEDGFNGNILIATQTAVSKDLTDFNLFITLMSYPLMGIKVILAIHWHALRLFLKGIRFHSYTEWVSNKYGLKKGVNR